MRPAPCVLAPFLLLLGLSAACAAPTGDPTTDESDFTEGSAEARVVLALVNDVAVTADELKSGARLTAPTASGIVAHRDGPTRAEGRPTTIPSTRSPSSTPCPASAPR